MSCTVVMLEEGNTASGIRPGREWKEKRRLGMLRMLAFVET